MLTEITQQRKEWVNYNNSVQDKGSADGSK